MNKDFKLFKPIFDLNPKEVEKFVKEKANVQFTKSLKLDTIDTFSIEVNWGVPANEFYVYLEPRYLNSGYKVDFQDSSIRSLEDYLKIKSIHTHFTFQEIYAKMTGKTVFQEEVLIPTKGVKKSLIFWYNRNETIVRQDINNNWYVLDWDYEKDKGTKKPVPDDLLKAVKSVNLLKSVERIERKIVEKRRNKNNG